MRSVIDQIKDELQKAQDILTATSKLMSEYAHERRVADDPAAAIMTNTLRSVDMVAGEKGILAMARLAVGKCAVQTQRRGGDNQS